MPVRTEHVLRTDVEQYCFDHERRFRFTEWRENGRSHWLGTCTHCKHAVRVEVRQDVRLCWAWSSGDTMYFSKRAYQSVPLVQGATYHASKSGAYVTVVCPHGCRDRGYQWAITCKRIEGHQNDAITCSAKCTSATGPNCECQCAGANHGSGHALSQRKS